MSAAARAFELVCTALVAGLGLWALSMWFQPLPVPALTAVAGGLLGYWLAREGRIVMTLAGLVLGGIPGTLVHAYMHYSEGRMDPDEGLAVHIGVDAAGGLVLAGLTLAVAVGVSRVIVPRIASRASEEGDT